ncbi:MAG: glycosyltransferase family 2 protein [Bacteroidia bacterium]|nr:glycosyltransferase family 2 protein [Bacteroidia bacterium]
MNVTVVIPTYNRIHKLKQILFSINNQTYKSFEVIVVDDGSREDVIRFVEGLKNNLNYYIRTIRQNNAGASMAINRGVHEAKDGLIVLFDDDIILLPDTIEKHVDFQARHRFQVIVSGSARFGKEQIINPLYEYKYYMEQTWEDEINAHEMPLKISLDKFYVTTANTSFHKNIFLKIGGMNDRLRDGYDVDFCLRALKNGIDVYFDTRIKTIHDDIFSLRHYAARQNAYMQSKKKIAEFLPEYKDFLLKKAEIKPGFFKKALYRILKNDKIITFVENSSLLNYIPKSLRYRIYGMCIASLSLDY